MPRHSPRYTPPSSCSNASGKAGPADANSRYDPTCTTVAPRKQALHTDHHMQGAGAAHVPPQPLGTQAASRRSTAPCRQQVIARRQQAVRKPLQGPGERQRSRREARATRRRCGHPPVSLLHLLQLPPRLPPRRSRRTARTPAAEPAARRTSRCCSPPALRAGAGTGRHGAPCMGGGRVRAASWVDQVGC